MTKFEPGDRVYVLDEGLEAMREIMRGATGEEPEPNHHGIVAEVYEDGETVLIHFDDGVGAPYPVAETRLLEVGGPVPVKLPCTCNGHYMPGVKHFVACCDEPHVEEQ